ncbi:hypothetical protein CANARDRAFT_30075 [[Candida] arabinofermentans NRRL YB-2248]|uniref:Peptide hydrolase n=1 Tax=[Candida] arabinofermentans NRRL YB-2248 TaxID=983967 RepID=A0A1E4SUX3_9ASCO|nr:hypothetical protein CANARDRAFT_30075 [[Candida] arabinofermentans NRRL YB-2248]
MKIQSKSLAVLVLSITAIAFPLIPQFPLFSTDEPCMISLKENEIQRSTEAKKLELKRAGIKLLDVTKQYKNLLFPENDHLFLNEDSSTPIVLAKPVPLYNYPNKTGFHPKEVQSLISEIDTEKLYTNLKEFSGFHSRYYKSERFMESSVWLYDKLISMVTLADNYNLTIFDHGSFPQPSYIFTINGSSDDQNTIVIGCHADSINLLWPQVLAAPGADDDGSGVVTVLETLRIITDNHLTFENTIEFHFYAAEEGGMLGSLDIFSTYSSLSNKKIVAMLEQDMTGYSAKSLEKGYPEHFGIITDYTSFWLSEFVKDVIDDYCSIPYLETECGYACSDHYSAMINGFPSSFVTESKFGLDSPYIHTTQDTIEKLSFLHIAEHVKLCLGYVYELGNFTGF